MYRVLLLMVALVFSAAAVQPAQPEKPKPKNKDQVTVSIKSRQFTPSKVTIKKGQTVVWTNNDDCDHAVEADDDSFSSGTLKKKATFQYTFKKTGKFPYACKFHPREKGTITVE
ncbi:MAG: cupredoxin domain-containing protein [Bacillota bacterium]